MPESHDPEKQSHQGAAPRTTSVNKFSGDQRSWVNAATESWQINITWSKSHKEIFKTIIHCRQKFSSKISVLLKNKVSAQEHFHKCWPQVMSQPLLQIFLLGLTGKIPTGQQKQSHVSWVTSSNLGQIIRTFHASEEKGRITGKCVFGIWLLLLLWRAPGLVL